MTNKSPEFDFASGSRIGERSSPGKVWGVPSGHASAAGRGGMTAEYAQELERRSSPLANWREPGVDRGMSGLDAYQGPTDYDAYKGYLNEEFASNPLTGELAGDPWQVSDTGGYNYQPEVYDAPTDSGH